MNGRASVASTTALVGAFIAGLTLLALAAVLRDDGPLGGYPDFHRRGR